MTLKSLVAVVLAIGLTSSLTAAEKGEYGKESSKFQKKEITAAFSGPIDTNVKPNPSENYVDVIVAAGTGSGGFTLLTTGNGSIVTTSNGHFVSTTLKPYGSTSEFWIYEVKDFLSGGFKVYHAFYKTGPDESTAFAVYLCTNVNNPTNFSQFQHQVFGYAVRGIKEP